MKNLQVYIVDYSTTTDTVKRFDFSFEGCKYTNKILQNTYGLQENLSNKEFNAYEDYTIELNKTMLKSIRDEIESSIKPMETFIPFARSYNKLTNLRNNKALSHIDKLRDTLTQDIKEGYKEIKSIDILLNRIKNLEKDIKIYYFTQYRK